MALPGSTLPRCAGGAPVPSRILPHLFLIFESDQPLSPSVRMSLQGVDTVQMGRTGQFVAKREGPAGRRLAIGLPDSWVSTAHAVLRYVAPSWFIEDINSKNGTLVNGRLEKLAELSDGDLVEPGPTFFLFPDALAISPDGPDVLKTGA